MPQKANEQHDISKWAQGAEYMACRENQMRKLRLCAGELLLPSLAQFQNEDSLSQAVLAKLLRGVSTRKYAGTTEHPSPCFSNLNAVQYGQGSRPLAKLNNSRLTPLTK